MFGVRGKIAFVPNSALGYNLYMPMKSAGIGQVRSQDIRSFTSMLLVSDLFRRGPHAFFGTSSSVPSPPPPHLLPKKKKKISLPPGPSSQAKNSLPPFSISSGGLLFDTTLTVHTVRSNPSPSPSLFMYVFSEN